jgi:hypothetical protein
LSEVYDRLNGQRISGITLKDGTEVRCPKPILVDHAYSNTPAEA